jgi:hypothetical protein
MLVVNGARAPMLARGESHFPVAMLKAFPRLQFDDAVEPKVAREVADAPGHHSDLRRGQLAQGRFVKMIEMRMREEDQINRGRSLILRPARLIRFSRKSQLAKFGSINTFKSVYCTRNDAWPIHVRPRPPFFQLSELRPAMPPLRESATLSTPSRRKTCAD